MNSTRFTSLVALVAAAAGLSLLVMNENGVVGVTGATLVAGSAIFLARQFWRESEKRSKREREAIVRNVGVKLEQMRNETQLSSASIETRLDDVENRVNEFTRGVLEYMAQLELEVADSSKKLQSGIDNVKELDERLHRGLDNVNRQAVRNRDDILTQISGVIGVYATLNPDLPYPPFGGWAISGDCAQRLITLILKRRPKAVLETGSGLSTLLAAQALEITGGDGHVYSLEHDEGWLQESRNLLIEHGLSRRASIFHTPLVDTKVGDETYLWYDLSSADLPEEVQLIFIDGPPKATGTLARFPALPVLHDRLSSGGVLLMDDARRPDEREAVARWQEQYPDLSYQQHPDAKGTVEIVKGSQ